jgi:hypothetical protein
MVYPKTQARFIAILFCATALGQNNPHLQGWEALPLVRYEVADVNVYVEEGPNALPLLP